MDIEEEQKQEGSDDVYSQDDNSDNLEEMKQGFSKEEMLTFQVILEEFNTREAAWNTNLPNTTEEFCYLISISWLKNLKQAIQT